MELSTHTKQVRYNDYRVVASLRLPFHVSIEDSDQNDSGVASIREYMIGTRSAPQHLVRPSVLISDVAIAGGAKATTAKGYLDHSTGFFIVEASINGKGPYPFILDTGGHNILTPQWSGDWT